MPPTTPPARAFHELSDSGLLWLINRTTFHPRGVALALHADGVGRAYGWSLLPSPDGGPWTYPEDVEAGHYRRAEATLADTLGHPVRPDDETRPPSRPDPDDEAGRPVRAPDADAPPPCPTSADADRPGADEGADIGRTDVRRAEIRQAIDGAFLAADEDGRPTRIVPAGALTLGPDGLTDTERQRKTIRDALNAELSHDDEAAVWGLTLAVSRALHAMPRYATAAEPSGIRGLLEHVGMDLTDRCITVVSRTVDHAPRSSCGLTGDLLSVDPAGGHLHAVPAEGGGTA